MAAAAVPSRDGMTSSGLQDVIDRRRLGGRALSRTVSHLHMVSPPHIRLLLVLPPPPPPPQAICSPDFMYGDET
ncbi:uncharacterized protein V6R79_010521 [Siganus canaliculatus]